MKDINTMFNNAKSYNEDDSQIHREAEYLQVNLSNSVSLNIVVANIKLERSE